jgi:hypothetical protein
MYAFAPEVDVRSMLHERQRVRLYISRGNQYPYDRRMS